MYTHTHTHTHIHTHTLTHTQASKLGLGKNKSIISYYTGHQVVQFNYSPLVVTFIAQTNSNTGKTLPY